MAIQITNIGAQITIAIDGTNHNYPVNSLTAEVVQNSNDTAVQIRHFGNVVHVFNNVANRVAVPLNTGATDLVAQLSFFFNSPGGGGGLSTALNGLTANLTEVKLGGALTEDTTIDGVDSFTLSLLQLKTFIAQVQGVNGNAFFAADDTQILAVFNDLLTAKGGILKIDKDLSQLQHNLALAIFTDEGNLNINAVASILDHSLLTIIKAANKGEATFDATKIDLRHDLVAIIRNAVGSLNIAAANATLNHDLITVVKNLVGSLTLNANSATITHNVAAIMGNLVGNLNIAAANATLSHGTAIIASVGTAILTINATAFNIAHGTRINLDAPKVFLSQYAAGKVLKTTTAGEIVAANDEIIQTQRLTSADFSTNSATFANTSQYIVIEPATAFGKTTINAVLNVFARTNAAGVAGEAILTESSSALGAFVDVTASLVAIPTSAIPASDPYVLRKSAIFTLPAAGGVYQLRVRRTAGAGGNVPQIRASQIRIIYS